MSKYAVGFKFNYDEELVYDFLVSVGKAITSTGQEVVKRKVSMKIKRNKYVVIKIKVKLEYGTVLKFKHVEPISFYGKLVTVQDNQGGIDKGDVMSQLESLGITANQQVEKEDKKPIGFSIE